MKQGDVVRVTTGDHAGQRGRVINVTGKWVTFVRADGRGVQERADWCEVVTNE